MAERERVTVTSDVVAAAKLRVTLNDRLGLPTSPVTLKIADAKSAPGRYRVEPASINR